MVFLWSALLRNYYFQGFQFIKPLNAADIIIYFIINILIFISSVLVFFYFHNAYDTVPRNKLIWKLEQMKTPCNITKLISNMLGNFTLKADKETIQSKRC